MKKALSFSVLFFFTIRIAFSGVSLKLTGGTTFLLRNDYNTGGQGIFDYYQFAYGNMTGQFSPLRLGTNFGAEVAIPIGKSMAVGLGLGYVHFSRDSQFGYQWTFFSSEETLKPNIRLIPLTLNVHYYASIRPHLKADYFAGAGYYLLKFDHDWSVQTSFFSYESNQTFESNTGNLGFQGGIGLEYELSTQIALVFQVTGQSIKFTEIKGAWNEKGSWFIGNWEDTSDTAYFWYYERRDSGNAFAQIAFSTEKPSETEYAVIRKGILNLSGISAAIGLKFFF